MKNLFLLVLLSGVLLSCNRSGGGDITYKNAYNVSLNGLNKKRGEVSALIAFQNNYESTDFKLKDVNVDILVDGIDVGTYFSTQPVSIKAQSEAKVPLSYSIDNSKLQNEDGSYASSFVVELNGTATFTNSNGVEEAISFKHKETIQPVVPKKQRKNAREEKVTSSDKDGDDTKLKRSEVRKLQKMKRRQGQE